MTGSTRSARYRAGQPVGWAELFADRGTFVPVPGHPWRTKRYWFGERTTGEDADPVDAILRSYAYTSYSDDSALSDIGIDSLARVQILVELTQDLGHDVDADDLAELPTVGAFRKWCRTLVAPAA
ncbi:MAG: hypothetical protein GEV07_12410 [Streptosporangiales bacterium]|nr:hypothetical protein [Streptosporangiales bacterium]